jgi:hypothetical protein
MKHAPLSERFWAKVRYVGDASSCWEWTAALNEMGYGVIGIGGRGTGNVRAHRLSYEMHVGPIPEGMFVCHRCDNPKCVRPSHLFLGTVVDNNADMVAKGRELHGERGPAAKLVEAQVIEARRRRLLGESCRSIGRALGVCHQTISLLTRGMRWKRVA